MLGSAVQLLDEERRIIQFIYENKEYYSMLCDDQVARKLKKSDCSSYFSSFGPNFTKSQISTYLLMSSKTFALFNYSRINACFLIVLVYIGTRIWSASM